MKGAADPVSFPWNVSVFPFGSKYRKKTRCLPDSLAWKLLELSEVKTEGKKKITPSSFPKEVKLCPQCLHKLDTHTARHHTRGGAVPLPDTNTMGWWSVRPSSHLCHPQPDLHEESHRCMAFTFPLTHCLGMMPWSCPWGRVWAAAHLPRQALVAALRTKA